MTQSAAERAYGAIRDRILDGGIAPGTMLGETGLAHELGMSRTPVRAALGRLQDEGWIVVYPQRGALVRGLDARAVAELAAARVLLEIEGARLASPEQREATSAHLEVLICRQRDALRDGELTGFVVLLQAFHRAFVEAGGSRVLLELYDRLADRHRFALSSDAAALFARAEESISEHDALVACFRGGDTERFGELLRAHVVEHGAPRDAG